MTRTKGTKVTKAEDKALWHHAETIRCPGCGMVQEAAVEHSEPFWTYIHHCVKCGFVIMESEWDKVEKAAEVV